MGNIEKITQFLNDSCQLMSYQLWEKVNEDQFSLTLSYGIEERLSFSTNESATRTYDFNIEDKRLFILRIGNHQQLTVVEQQQLESLLQIHHLEKMLKKEQFIRKKMMESIREISAVNDLQSLLTKILENALSVIPVADFGVLWMYDEEEGALLPKAWVGGPGEDIQHMRMTIGEGIIGKTFLEKRSMLLTSYQDVLTESSSITVENMQHLLSAYTFEDLQSVISTPILVEEQALCVLIIYQKGQIPLLTVEDQQLLESFSDQVSIALMNARLFQHLKQQNELLRQRDHIHHTLMNLSLQNTGIQMIVNEIRRILQLRLVVIDLIDNSIFASPRHWFEESDYKRIFIIPDRPTFSKVETEEGMICCYIQPIVGVGQTLGMLLIEVEKQQLLPLHKMIIEQASAIFALEMIRKQSIVDSFYKKTHDLFREFIQCKDYLLLEKKGEELGLQSSAFSAVLFIQLPISPDLQGMNVQTHILIGEIRQIFQDKVAIIFGFDNKVTVVSQFQRQVDDLVKRTKQLQMNWQKMKYSALKIGIGSLYQGFENIAKSYHEAEKALSFLITRHRDGIMHYQDIGVNRLFIHQTQEELTSFVNEIFEPLANDKTKYPLLEETLLAYMAHNSSVGETAKQLHIHVNTLYQRLKKIEEKLNISFQNAEDMLKLQLACYLKGMVE
ncbi:helix-turn-helix domain-containing protein [Lysinibacillus piscis]|uniref:GAF domain-containing protein n=1 Tax=Lysinibacillus piscis TaxID=2518931 RepID=A0ABQ5NJY9_9BACI|nr:helix-turn-helix domain-containing protein [Lysinibacillus sp. KH24]GLC88387.1 hypothetical protein LYSBPC_15140 [Lysinibacillus sp. KH24]